MDNYEPVPDLSVIDAQHQDLMNFLTNNSDMRAAAKSSIKQGLYAGGGAVAGGFLLGPVGGLVGGIVGSIAGFFKSEDYDGAVLTLVKLPEPQKRVLMQRVGEVLILAGAGASQIMTGPGFHDALVEFASRRSVRDDLWNACVQSLQQ